MRGYVRQRICTCTCTCTLHIHYVLDPPMPHQSGRPPTLSNLEQGLRVQNNNARTSGGKPRQVTATYRCNRVPGAPAPPLHPPTGGCMNMNAVPTNAVALHFVKSAPPCHRSACMQGPAPVFLQLSTCHQRATINMFVIVSCIFTPSCRRLRPNY